ncbi:MAG: hypothetical protein M3413_01225 [Bacteroidota bacterium]|nr:hypothetical protein [Bacteroidota bacterium]
MKHIFSLQLLKGIAFCLFIILLISLGIIYAQFIWHVYEQLTNTLNSSVNQADHYLLSLSN